MGKIIKYQNIIKHLIGIALFLLTAILMMWLSSPNGPIYNSKTKGLDAQKLKIQSEIMQFSDQYQIILKGDVLVKLRRTLLSENFHTPMGSSHCWLYAAV